MVEFVLTPATLKNIRTLVAAGYDKAAIAFRVGLGRDVNALERIATKHFISLKKDDDTEDRSSKYRERKFNRSPWMDFKRGGE